MFKWFKNKNDYNTFSVRSLHYIKQLCTSGYRVLSGHGHIGNASDVVRAIKALEPVVDSNLMDMDEKKCVETWKKLSSASSFPSENTFWVEWNQFLKVPIVQSDIFSFAKLIDEHEH